MKIGITYNGSAIKQPNYENWIRSGDNIEIILLSEETNNLCDVALCDGIVLSGGVVDLSPKIYGGNLLYAHAPKKFNDARDIFETEVLKITQQENLPVLGICRGLQLVNCIYGGTLKQDLEEKNEVHQVSHVADKVHGINAVRGSLIFEIIGNEFGAVNSAHHQAIDQLGEGLKITAISEDGIPEVLERIENESSPFLLCVQWHPERMYQFGLENTPPSKGLREKFLDAIKNK